MGLMSVHFSGGVHSNYLSTLTLIIRPARRMSQKSDVLFFTYPKCWPAQTHNTEKEIYHEQNHQKN